MKSEVYRREMNTLELLLYIIDTIARIKEHYNSDERHATQFSQKS